MDPRNAKERARRLAARQAGRITYQQLALAGLTAQRIKVGHRNGDLVRTRPRVYAIGYVRTDLLARVWEAILYAGPGAYLTGASGAHQRELIDYPPRDVVVATPRRCRSLPGITVLPRRPSQRHLYRSVPVAPLPELMLELAATCEYNLVRKALANLDYRRQLEVQSLLAACARGRQGSAQLRRALEQRLPQLAYTNGPLEEAFLFLLETHGLRLPRFNVRIHGILADVYWPELNLVVELDGEDNHGTAAQRRRDARDAATLRSHGLTVLRFDWHDVHTHTAATLQTLVDRGVQRA